jgi:hypothetical protein
MQSKLHCGLFIGSPRTGIKPGRLVTICEVTFETRSGETLTLWEVKPPRARAEDDWISVDRLDLVIPGLEREADQLRMLLVKPLETRYLQEA